MQIDFSYEDAIVNPDNLKRDPLLESWNIQDGSVLLMDKIKDYCENPDIKLIYPFNKDRLKSASYKLSLGKRYRLDTVDYELTDSNPIIFIPPHGIVMVETYEWINLPGYLIARWNLDTHKVYKGLVWVGGPQIDPGFQGHLSCPIYNLSNTVQKIKYKEPIFIIDFVHTSSFIQNKSVLWKSDRKTYSPAYAPLDEDKILSAPAETNKKAEDATTEVRRLQNIMFISLAIVIAAVTILATLSSLEPIKVPADWVDAGPSWLSILAILISIFALLKVCCRRRR